MKDIPFIIFQKINSDVWCINKVNDNKTVTLVNAKENQ